MAALTASPRRSLIGSAVAAFHARAKAQRRLSRLAAAIVRMREQLPTLAAMTAADLGGFQVFHHGGWFVLAGSVLLAHFAVTGR